MRYILLILAILAISPLKAENIKWSNDLWKSIEKAKESKKSVLVYMTMDNCRYCTMMENNTWKDNSVISYVNKNFIPVRLKYGINSEIKLFKVKGFPQTAIVKSNTVVLKKAGFIQPRNLLEILSKNK